MAQRTFATIEPRILYFGTPAGCPIYDDEVVMALQAAGRLGRYNSARDV